VLQNRPGKGAKPSGKGRRRHRKDEPFAVTAGGATQQVSPINNAGDGNEGVLLVQATTDEMLKKPHRLAPSRKGRRHYPGKEDTFTTADSDGDPFGDTNRPLQPTDDQRLKMPRLLANSRKELGIIPKGQARL
jgi:hypothetical protein